MKCLLVLFVLIIGSRAHTECNTPIVIPRQTIVSQNGSSSARSKRATQNLRITRYYDSSFTSLPNQADVKSLVLDPAIEFWQNSLYVKNPLTSPLVIDRDCSGSFYYKTIETTKIKVCSTACTQPQLCYTTPIPDTYLKPCYTSYGSSGYSISGPTGAGAPNTDILLIITQKSEGCATNVLAYALACELEQTLDRPVVGLINICPGRINFGVGLKMSIATIKHEIVHVLGLSSNLFAFYRSADGRPLTPRDSNGVPNLGFKSFGNALLYQYSDITVKEYSKTFNYINGQRTKIVSYIVTPTVQTEIRNYFNCQTLEGMMLEDYGSSGSALSHFKKLYLQSELMTASISVISQASRLTFAVLQDTGWYIANFANAENFTFAQKLGCPFVTSSCYDYMNLMASSNKPLAPFCNTPVLAEGISCTADRKIQTFCSLIDSSYFASNVPSQYKYFSNPNLVSTDPFSDYCPFISVYALTLSGTILQTGECADSENSLLTGSRNDAFNQGFGKNSLCVNFPKSPPWYYESCGTSTTPSIQGSGCYQYQCIQNYGLIINVNNFQYQCITTNQVIDVTSRNTYLIAHGKLVCPDCSSICGTSICNSVTSTMSVLCNNVDRFCSGVTTYVPPCSAVSLKVGHIQILFMSIVLLTIT